MVRRTEIREETIEHEVTFIACDICGEEVPIIEGPPIFGSDFQSMADNLSGSFRSNRWWVKPFEKIVGVSKGHAADQIKHAPDFEIHVKCGYEAIRAAVAKAKGKTED